MLVRCKLVGHELVGLVNVSIRGDVHLDHLEPRRALGLELLGTRTLGKQTACEHLEVGLVELPREQIAEASVAACD